MKQIYCYLLVLLGFAITACNNGNNPEWAEQYKEGTYYIVKFNPLAASYYGNVMLVQDANGEYKMRSLANGGTCRELFLGHTPFTQIDTVEHWYLADWKWGLYLSYNHVVLPVRWQDITKPDEKYVRSDFETTASNIINRFGTIKRSEIDRYLGITPAPAADYPGPWGYTSGGISTDHLAPVYLNRYYSVQDIPDVIDQKGDWKYTKEDFLKERKRQDSLQNVYTERLATLVYEGAVDIVIHEAQR